MGLSSLKLQIPLAEIISLSQVGNQEETKDGVKISDHSILAQSSVRLFPQPVVLPHGSAEFCQPDLPFGLRSQLLT